VSGRDGGRGPLQGRRGRASRTGLRRRARSGVQAPFLGCRDRHSRRASSGGRSPALGGGDRHPRRRAPGLRELEERPLDRALQGRRRVEAVSVRPPLAPFARRRWPGDRAHSRGARQAHREVEHPGRARRRGDPTRGREREEHQPERGEPESIVAMARQDRGRPPRGGAERGRPERFAGGASDHDQTPIPLESPSWARVSDWKST
jgi:hypothetical protein